MMTLLNKLDLLSGLLSQIFTISDETHETYKSIENDLQGFISKLLELKTNVFQSIDNYIVEVKELYCRLGVDQSLLLKDKDNLEGLSLMTQESHWKDKSIKLQRALEAVSNEIKGLSTNIEEILSSFESYDEKSNYREKFAVYKALEHPSEALKHLKALHNDILTKLSQARYKYEELLNELKTCWRMMDYIPETQEEELILHVQTEIELENNSTSFIVLLKANITPERVATILEESKRALIERKSENRKLISAIKKLMEECEEKTYNEDELNTLSDRVDHQTLNKLINIQAGLVEKRKAIYKPIFDKYSVQLQALMDELKISSSEQVQILNSLHNSSMTMPEIANMYKDSIKSLEERRIVILNIEDLYHRRNELIAAMKRFEISASDPSRLFSSSFRLLSEAKFRKTALPDLQQLEKSLMNTCCLYRTRYGQNYTVYNGPTKTDQMDLETLINKEINERFINSSLFDFQCSNHSPKKQSYCKSLPTMKYNTNHPLPSLKRKSDENGSNEKKKT